jgi:hypothetical protein
MRLYMKTSKELQFVIMEVGIMDEGHGRYHSFLSIRFAGLRSQDLLADELSFCTERARLCLNNVYTLVLSH